MSRLSRLTSDEWTRIRFVLGTLQMAGAVVALALLVQVGVTRLSLAAVVLTSALTTLSVMLFGNRPTRGPK